MEKVDSFEGNRKTMLAFPDMKQYSTQLLSNDFQKNEGKSIKISSFFAFFNVLLRFILLL